MAAAGLFDGISAVIPTRGDVDITTVLNNLPFDDVVVWNNAERSEDLSCYGRFAAVAEAKHDWIYTQDDDILVPVPAFLKGWQARWSVDIGIYANKPPAETWRFLGVGAIFHRSLLDITNWCPVDEFNRVADVVFAYQHTYRHGWFGYAELEWSRAPNSMYLQDDHYIVREQARDRTLALPNNPEKDVIHIV